MAMAAAGKVAAVAAAGRTAAKRSPRVSVRPITQQSQYKPVITAMTVIVIVRFLDSWLVEKRTLPSRRDFFSLAILGFVLALLSDLAPKVGKGFSYLVLTAVVFGGTAQIWEAITTEELKPESDSATGGASSSGSAPLTQPASSRRGSTLFINVNNPQRTATIQTLPNPTLESN